MNNLEKSHHMRNNNISWYFEIRIDWGTIGRKVNLKMMQVTLKTTPLHLTTFQPNYLGLIWKQTKMTPPQWHLRDPSPMRSASRIKELTVIWFLTEILGGPQEWPLCLMRPPLGEATPFDVPHNCVSTQIKESDPPRIKVEFVRNEDIKQRIT